jgi:hypothetical protein
MSLAPPRRRRLQPRTAVSKELEEGDDVTIKFDHGTEVQGHLRMASDRNVKSDVRPVVWD